MTSDYYDEADKGRDFWEFQFVLSMCVCVCVCSSKVAQNSTGAVHDWMPSFHKRDVPAVA